MTPPEIPGTSPQGAAKSVRPLGWLLVVLGLFLSVGMAVIANFLREVIAHNHDPGAHSHWNGSEEFTYTTFRLFGSIFLFGVAAIGTGIYQISTGRRSRLMIVLMLGLVGAMCYFGYGIVSTRIPS